MSDTIMVKYMNQYFELDKQLYTRINKLPPQLRNYLYIWCMKLFWRQYIPVTAKIPMWNDYANYQRNLLFQARQHNIHFLHLPCNTLPENKRYIIGCQCFFCKHVVDESYKKHELCQNLIDYTYFKDTMPNTETHWNNFYEYVFYDEYAIPTYKSFNCNYDYFNLHKLINGPPIYFTQTS